MFKHFFLFGALLTGCISNQQRAQVALTTTARALVAVDDTLAPHYETAAEQARISSSNWAEYDQAMVTWNRAEQAERATQHALLAAQSSLDAWEHGNETGWLSTAPCLVRTADELVIALEAVNLEVAPLREALVVLGAFVGVCHAE